MLPYSFWKDVEARLPHILYGDTDSLFINLPTVKVDENNLQPTYDTVKTVSEGINDALAEHMNQNVLPLLGIDPEYNRTVFKTEIISNAIFFSGKKKNYAYRLIAKEWNEIKHKPIEYTGLTTKSDLTKASKEIIHGLIENIMFNTEYSIEEKNQLAIKFVIQYKEKILNDINELNIIQIGQPKKWSIKTKNNEDTWQIYSMRLFNTIMDDPIFKPMSGGIAIPIIITNPGEFIERIKDIRSKNEMYLNDSPMSKLNYISFPYEFDKDLVKSQMEKYFITIDSEKLWNTICNTQIQDIMSLFKQYSNPINQLIGQIH